MKRMIAILVVALAVVMAGCGEKEPPRNTLPSTIDKFDKKEVPTKAPGQRAAPG